MALRIIHISDLHVGWIFNESSHLQTVVNSILTNYLDKPTTILITGDIVNDGQEGQFQQTKKILESLIQHPNATLLPIPGNHDYGWMGNHAESRRFKYFKAAFYPLENVTYPHIKSDQDGNVFIGLNSMAAETDGIDGLLAQGELGAKQLAALGRFLGEIEKAKVGGKNIGKVIVHLHHHPFIYPDDTWIEEGYEKGCHWLKDGKLLMPLIAGRVDALLFGHEHRHLDFSGTSLAKRYRIPCLLSSGKSTDPSGIEYSLNAKGEKTGTVLQKGLLGRLIEFSSTQGFITTTIIF